MEAARQMLRNLIDQVVMPHVLPVFHDANYARLYINRTTSEHEWEAKWEISRTSV